jgi:thiamine-monophosphate kinase
MTDATTVGSLGEFALIDRLRRICGETQAPGLLLGIGDDTAAFEGEPSAAFLATCDIQVEGVHFRREWSSPAQLGRRAVAVNLSDVAAMGGAPRMALVSLAFPGELPLSVFDGLFDGMSQAMREHGGAVAGGNLARAPQLVIDITMIGAAPGGRYVTRSGAEPGDAVYVTGTLGDAAAGLETCLRGEASDIDEHACLVRRLIEPTARVHEGAQLGEWGLVSAMIDLSDGLAADLGHVCDASGVGVEIRRDDLPLSEELRRYARAKRTDASRIALAGGDDYELLFTVPPSAMGEVERRTRGWSAPIRRIGTILPAEEGRSVATSVGREALSSVGWDHFRSNDDANDEEA